MIEYTVTVYISNGINIREHKFKINVINRPPYFDGSPPIVYNTDFNIPKYFDLPSIIDPEKLNTTLKISAGPSYITKISNKRLQVYP